MSLSPIVCFREDGFFYVAGIFRLPQPSRSIASGTAATGSARLDVLLFAVVYKSAGKTTCVEIVLAVAGPERKPQPEFTPVVE